jgi:hypothetical protein
MRSPVGRLDAVRWLAQSVIYPQALHPRGKRGRHYQTRTLGSPYATFPRGCMHGAYAGLLIRREFVIHPFWKERHFPHKNNLQLAPLLLGCMVSPIPPGSIPLLSYQSWNRHVFAGGWDELRRRGGVPSWLRDQVQRSRSRGGAQTTP